MTFSLNAERLRTILLSSFVLCVMRIGLVTPEGNYFPLDVADIKAQASIKCAIPSDQIALRLNANELLDSRLVGSLGLAEHDILSVERKASNHAAAIKNLVSNLASNLRQAQGQPQQSRSGAIQEAQTFRQQAIGNAALMQQIRQRDPELGNLIDNGTIEQLSYALQERLRRQRMAQQHQHQQRQDDDLMDLDPFSIEYQRRLEERIEQDNILENMENAMEYLPESFGRVVMLYVPAKVNNSEIKAFVDSGAQQTIMSESCARRCGLMRLLDRRFSGIAQGVGTAKILGRVHLAPIQIGNSHFPCSFTILEDQGLEFLLGLDFLRRFQCQIDLKSNVLRIGEEAVEFLSEKDIPVRERNNELTEQQQQEIEQRELQEAMQNSAAASSVLSSGPPSQSSSSSAQATDDAARTFPEDTVQSLIQLGYPRVAVVAALEAAGGDADVAASILIAMN